MAEVVVVRQFGLPQEVVFSAWLDPSAAGRWLFATPDGCQRRCSLEPRVGGEFLFAETRDGASVEHRGHYTAINPSTRLAFSFSVGLGGQPTEVEVRFGPLAGGCTVTLCHQLGPCSTELEARVRLGWSQILGSLERELKGGHVLKMVRRFNAPPELVFRAWTEPELLARWSCPHGFTIVSGSSDVRPGGAWRCAMKAPDGRVHTAAGVYRELIAPRRLGFTHAWESEAGSMGHESLVTVALDDEDGGTKMTFTQCGLASAESCAGHEQGWSQGLEKLAELVRGLTAG